MTFVQVKTHNDNIKGTTYLGMIFLREIEKTERCREAT